MQFLYLFVSFMNPIFLVSARQMQVYVLEAFPYLERSSWRLETSKF